MDRPTQADLFPYATPLTCLAACRRIEAMVLTVAPEMTPHQCDRIMCELCTAMLLLERMGTPLKIPPHPDLRGLPENVLTFCRDVERLIESWAPIATVAQCLTVLEELVHTTATVDSYSLEIRQGREWQRRQQLPSLPAPTIADPIGDRLEAARHWRAAYQPIKYEKRQPDWPDLGGIRRTYFRRRV